MLEDKQRFKLGGVDTSPSYLLFQTLLPLFWTLTCMIWMTNPDWCCFQQNSHGVIFVQKQKFSEWPETPRRLFLEIIKNIGERIKARGPHPVHEGGGAPPPPGRAPCLVGPLMLHRPQLQLYIFRFTEEKIREKVSSCFTIRSRRQALISLGRADMESVRAPERGIRRRRHYQPSSITNFMMLTAVRE